MALAQVALPGEEGIGPAAHRVLVSPELGDAEGRAPVIVAEELHRHNLPVARAGVAPEKLGDDRVVAVGEDVGLDEHLVPDGALHRIAPAVDLGTDRLDDDPRRSEFLYGVAIQA